MKEIIITEICKETEKLANRLSRRFLKLKPAKRALVIGLIGELGAGKTVLAKGFAKGLGIKKIITSPTFVLENLSAVPMMAMPKGRGWRDITTVFIIVNRWRDIAVFVVVVFVVNRGWGWIYHYRFFNNYRYRSKFYIYFFIGRWKRTGFYS